MKPYAAIDLRQGNVVQLVGGDPAEERIRLGDAIGVAQAWEAAGFRELHIVDLDAALGTGSNCGVIRDLLRSTSASVQVGGGVRDAKTIEAILDAGAARVVVGTRAVIDRHWLTEIAELFPGRVVLAADSRDGRVVVNGWTADSGISTENLLREVRDLALAAVLITDVTREGKMQGIDAEFYRRLCRDGGHPVLASGGITTIDDLRTLEAVGAAGAILGMAIYTGSLDAALVTTESGR
ncbi:MAG TPA: 1-(5-phosphoribosyl)-5-[(5-phosphoribosylamino)methylideneamino] imidazole-4-carboxamide isomerase [Longimicrobiaceae bacterium]|nr:1-(5-phosphoribosyl)-5-[(5-phosphoribosylamino)methylideneamino] imidazole-4-carboxamide isomerase [Longimicrobiaceae bacterium]